MNRELNFTFVSGHDYDPSISHFFKRDVNKAFAKVVGEKVNRGAGYGLEIPCM